MTLSSLPSIAKFERVTKDQFLSEIVPLNRPALLKGLVNEWPIVRASTESADGFLNYLKSFHYIGKVEVVRARAKENGFFTYNKRFSGFNFERKNFEFSAFLEALAASAVNPQYATHSWQSAYIDDYFDGFLQQHPMPLLPDSVRPRIWIGNKTIVGVHQDDSDNIACAIAGKRRFALFPPEQLENLYIGPLDKTPAGAPISMVDFTQPDFEKFPRAKEALATASIAELEPGDAIYIPALWWHHVESLEGINGLVNYWYSGALDGAKSLAGLDSMLLARLTFAGMSPAVKAAWRNAFEYYVWSDNTNFEHIPEQLKGVLGDVSKQESQQIIKWLASKLNHYADEQA